MKKVFPLMAVVAAVTFSSCVEGSTDGKVAEEDSLLIDTVATLEENTVENLQAELTRKLQSGDAEQLKDVIDKMAEELQKALESGDQEQVQKYASQFKAFMDENSDKLKSLDVNAIAVSKLQDAMKSLPSDVQGTVQDAKNAAKTDADVAGEADVVAKDTAEAEAEVAANKVVEDAQAKDNEAVDDAIDNAQDDSAKERETQIL